VCAQSLTVHQLRTKKSHLKQTTHATSQCQHNNEQKVLANHLKLDCLVQKRLGPPNNVAIHSTHPGPRMIIDLDSIRILLDTLLPPPPTASSTSPTIPYSSLSLPAAAPAPPAALDPHLPSQVPTMSPWPVDRCSRQASPRLPFRCFKASVDADSADPTYLCLSVVRSRSNQYKLAPLIRSFHIENAQACSGHLQACAFRCIRRPSLGADLSAQSGVPCCRAVSAAVPPQAGQRFSTELLRRAPPPQCGGGARQQCPAAGRVQSDEDTFDCQCSES
jgi:hypothetical protein